MVDSDRLLAAYQTARCDLLAECESTGHWVGQLSSSPLATATAISALALVGRHAPATDSGALADDLCRGETSRLIVKSLRWLMKTQAADGGWGDTAGSPSNIVATMLVRAAFCLTCVPGDDDDMLERADAYIERHGGLAAVRRRCSGNKPFAAAVLANLALAGLAPWSEVPQLAFELAGTHSDVWNRLRSPVGHGDLAPHDVAAVIAVGQARFCHRKPLNPLLRAARCAAIEGSLAVLEKIQPPSGGFLEATPLTSFVVMSLASLDRCEHSVVRRGVEFLLSSVRGDGSWALETDLAVRNTALAVNALAGGGEQIETATFDWLVGCQRHETSGNDADEKNIAGGWAATDLGGALANCDDTAAALLALSTAPVAFEHDNADWAARRTVALAAAKRGALWLLELQNDDGGWPLTYQGDGKLPLCRSASELTAHALRALHAWRSRLVGNGFADESTAIAEADLSAKLDLADDSADERHELGTRIAAALEGGLRYLLESQQPDGSWNPLWFGNPYREDQQSPTFGTARVLLALGDLGRLDTTAARRGLDWLSAAQNDDGGWGSRRKPDVSPAVPVKVNSSKTVAKTLPPPELTSSVEETAVAVECLASCGRAAVHEAALTHGLKWLSDAVEGNRHLECSPIGLDFAKLWYHEKLYPLVCTAAALGQAVHRRSPQSAPPSTLHLGKA